jgi:hypothetical protein
MATKPSLLTTLAEQKTAAELQTMSRESLKWLVQKVATLRNPLAISVPMTKEKGRFVPKGASPQPNVTKKFRIGSMYFFAYDPKGKNELDYYDKFPLVLPLESYPDGFLGLNLHYLPMRYRIYFMRKLMPRAVLNDDNEIMRLRISYEMLDASRRYKEFRPCVKRYLYSHIRSRILAVEPEEWDIAMYLPVQQFKKAPASKVWKESVEEIRNS